MLLFHCAHCGYSLAVSEKLAGQDTTCPGCERVTQVPGEAVEAAAAPVLTPPLAPRQIGVTADVGVAVAERPPGVSRCGWVMIPTGLAAGFAVYNTPQTDLFGRIDPVHAFPRTLGFFVGLVAPSLLAGLIGGFLMQLMKRSFAASFQRTYMLAVVCLGAVATLGDSFLKEAAARKHHEEMSGGNGRAQAQAATSVPTLPQALVQAYEAIAPGRLRVEGSGAALDRRLLRNKGLALYNALVDENIIYQRAAKNLNVARVLSPAVMERSGTRAEALEALARAKTLAEAGRESAKKLLCTAASRATDADVPEGQKAVLKAAMQTAVDHSAPLISAVWDSELEALDMVDALAQILSNSGALAAYGTKLQELQRFGIDQDAKREAAYESLRRAVILPGEE